MTVPKPPESAFSPRIPAAVVDLQPFADLVATLRSPVGCPWDREQTHETIVPYTIEETWELAEAVREGVDAAVREELGDVLLQVVLHAQIAADRGAFTLQDVIDGIAVKMLARHPHVFGEEQAASANAARLSWRRSKRAEGKGVLDGIPRSMPSLERADRVVRRAAEVGFDWPDADAVLAKVQEECDEVRAELARGDMESAADEVGDLIFASVSLAAHLGSNAPAALSRTLERFSARFALVERFAAEQGEALEDLDPAALDGLWERAKQVLRESGPVGQPPQR